MTHFRAWYNGHKKITVALAIAMTTIYLGLLAFNPDIAQEFALAYLVGIGTVVVLVEVGSSNSNKKGKK